MDDADADADAVIAVGGSPRIAGGRECAANDADSFALVVMRGVHVVFCADAETLEAFVESGALGYGGTIARGVNGETGANVGLDTAHVFGADADDGAIFGNDVSGGGAHAELRAGINGTLGEILKNAAHVQDAGKGGGILARDDAVCRMHAPALEWMVEVGGDAEFDGIADECSARSASRGADFGVGLENDDGAATRRERFGGSETAGTASCNYDIILHGHLRCSFPTARLRKYPGARRKDLRMAVR